MKKAVFHCPHLEHERVRPRVEPGVAEDGLDGVVRAEDDGSLRANLQGEDVAVLSTQSREGPAQVQHVQEGQVAQDCSGGNISMENVQAQVLAQENLAVQLSP